MAIIENPPCRIRNAITRARQNLSNKEGLWILKWINQMGIPSLYIICWMYLESLWCTLKRKVSFCPLCKGFKKKKDTLFHKACFGYIQQVVFKFGLKRCNCNIINEIIFMLFFEGDEKTKKQFTPIFFSQ